MEEMKEEPSNRCQHFFFHHSFLFQNSTISTVESESYRLSRLLRLSILSGIVPLNPGFEERSLRTGENGRKEEPSNLKKNIIHVILIIHFSAKLNELDC